MSRTRSRPATGGAGPAKGGAAPAGGGGAPTNEGGAPAKRRAAAVGGAGVPVARGDLAGLASLDADALGLFCFADQRPLSGVAGYVDWRTCGALSRALESGAFAGERDETMLMPTTGRLGQRRLFVFGLGPLASCSDEVLRAACRLAHRVMEQAGVQRPVLAAPAVRGGARPLEDEFVRVVAEELGGAVARVLVG